MKNTQERKETRWLLGRRNEERRQAEEIKEKKKERPRAKLEKQERRKKEKKKIIIKDWAFDQVKAQPNGPIHFDLATPNPKAQILAQV
jgi:hypothetical protein